MTEKQKVAVERSKPLALKFKPEFQAQIDAGVYHRPLIRRRTDAEIAAREFERTKDYQLCVCCGFKKSPHQFNSPIVLVCHQCAWRASVYGRRATYQRVEGAAEAMAVIRTMERTACRMR